MYLSGTAKFPSCEFTPTPAADFPRVSPFNFVAKVEILNQDLATLMFTKMARFASRLITFPLSDSLQLIRSTFSMIRETTSGGT
ncbi:uncharacterized protein EI90DRAFT_2978810 [Cantharellus anzutake]|uniref:uncharacterized protein n=1 Tax=Cantharellus anzutake TaxID=1750568 RepID=UPI001906300B|nr:uncharacterized protein EI90DRAFT_2978810 [Cantharellus anzutake]KAF8318554.1 hypothetical protein EI90DRAFT_2978810 [Cantharellus anzutake]